MVAALPVFQAKQKQAVLAVVAAVLILLMEAVAEAVRMSMEHYHLGAIQRELGGLLTLEVVVFMVALLAITEILRAVERGGFMEEAAAVVV
jgi:hypothetical protein